MRMKEIGGETDRRSHHGTLRIIDVRLPKEVLIQEVTMDLDQHLGRLNAELRVGVGAMKAAQWGKV